MSNPTNQTPLKNSQEMETLYGAFANLGFGHAPELKIQEISVNKMISAANNSQYLELESEYPVSKNFRTALLPIERMNSVLRTGEKSFAFYSEEYEQCEKWLCNFKRHLTDYHKNRCIDMENLEIQFVSQQNTQIMM